MQLELEILKEMEMMLGAPYLREQDSRPKAPALTTTSGSPATIIHHFQSSPFRSHARRSGCESRQEP